jgi:hypothetical protein
MYFEDVHFIVYYLYLSKKKVVLGRCQWLTPIILATWEDEIWRIMVRGQPRQKVLKNPISKITTENGLEVWLKQRAPAL